MFAVSAARFSPDDPVSALDLGERPDPIAKDGWVTVNIKAASLNQHDLWSLRGVGLKADQLPMILGCDAQAWTRPATRSSCTRSSATRTGRATRRSTRGARCS